MSKTKKPYYSIYKQEDDLGDIYYEVVWITDYGTKDAESHFKHFDTMNEAKLFVKDSASFYKNLELYKNFI